MADVNVDVAALAVWARTLSGLDPLAPRLTPRTVDARTPVAQAHLDALRGLVDAVTAVDTAVSQLAVAARSAAQHYADAETVVVARFRDQ